MNLREIAMGEEHTVLDIRTGDDELNAFLLSLGCYAGQGVTVVSRHKGGCVLAIKDGRYNIDNALAEAITVQ